MIGTSPDVPLRVPEASAPGFHHRPRGWRPPEPDSDTHRPRPVLLLDRHFRTCPDHLAEGRSRCRHPNSTDTAELRKASGVRCPDSLGGSPGTAAPRRQPLRRSAGNACAPPRATSLDLALGSPDFHPLVFPHLHRPLRGSRPPPGTASEPGIGDETTITHLAGDFHPPGRG